MENIKSSNDKYENIKKVLEKITQVIAAFCVGDFSKRLNVDEFSCQDEDIKRMVYGIDMLLDELYYANQKLSDTTHNLEEEIKIHTSQLLETNKKLSSEIEKRKKIEEELKKSEEQYRILAESAEDFIYIFDRNYNLTYINSAVEKILGLSRKEVIGKNISDFIPLSEIGLDKEDIFKAFEENRTFPREFKFNFKNNQMWLDSILVPIRNEEGRITSIFGISRDITKIKENNEALIESEKFLSDVFSSIQDGISVLDTDLNIIRVNSKMEALYSHAMPFIGKKCYQVYQTRTTPCLKCPSITAIKTKKPSYEIVPLTDKNGQIKGWLDLYSFPLTDEKTGKVIGVIEYVRDITARKEAEEKLKQSELLFRTLAENSGAGIFIVKNNKFCYVNHYITQNLGYSYEEMCNMNFWDVVHDEHKKKVIEINKARISGEKVVNKYEFKYVRKDGTIGWVETNNAIFELNGEPAIIGTIFEITARKQIEEQLAREKELLAVTISNIDDGIITIDSNCFIKAINKKAFMFLNDDYTDVVDKNINNLINIIDENTQDIYKKFFENIIIDKKYKIKNKVIKIINKAKKERIIEFSLEPFFWNKNNFFGFVIVLRDITEKQIFDNELIKIKKLESLGVLAGGIAHDFNNILTGIITNIYMVKQSQNLNKENIQLLQEAEKAALRAGKLVKQLLTFSKGGLPIKEPLSVKEIIQECVSFCLAGSNVKYRLNIPEDLMFIDADRSQIEQVFNNLIINADQAMPKGGIITISAENITISKEDEKNNILAKLEHGNYIKVIVEDQGIGIKKQDLDKIFDPYFTTKPKGNGLGLTIVYSIIKNHNGIITVDSEVDKGTTFTIYLPAIKSAHKYKIVENKNENKIKKNLNILFMDDDEAITRVMPKLLKSYGHNVVCVNSGEESIEQYIEAKQKGTPFDVVVMDLTIKGGMGGKDAVRLLKEKDPHAKVIVSSGYSNDPIMANYKDFGFDAAISKPFEVEEVIRVLKNIINYAS